MSWDSLMLALQNIEWSLTPWEAIQYLINLVFKPFIALLSNFIIYRNAGVTVSMMEVIVSALLISVVASFLWLAKWGGGPVSAFASNTLRRESQERRQRERESDSFKRKTYVSTRYKN